MLVDRVAADFTVPGFAARPRGARRGEIGVCPQPVLLGMINKSAAVVVFEHVCLILDLLTIVIDTSNPWPFR